MLRADAIIDEARDLKWLRFIALARSAEDAKAYNFIDRKTLTLEHILEIGKDIQFTNDRELARRLTRKQRVAFKAATEAATSNGVLIACESTASANEISAAQTIVCYNVYIKRNELLKPHPGAVMDDFLGACGFPVMHEGELAPAFMTFFQSNRDDPNNFRSYIRTYSHTEFLQHLTNESE